MKNDSITKIDRISFERKNGSLYELYCLETDFSRSFIFRAFDGECEAIELLSISEEEASRLFAHISEGELSVYQLEDVADDCRQSMRMAKF